MFVLILYRRLVFHRNNCKIARTTDWEGTLSLSVKIKRLYFAFVHLSRAVGYALKFIVYYYILCLTDEGRRKLVQLNGVLAVVCTAFTPLANPVHVTGTGSVPPPMTLQIYVSVLKRHLCAC